MEPVSLRFDLTTRADPAAAWDVLADTDRFNRAAGLGFELEEVAEAPGRVRRVGRVRKFGITLEWEEQPIAFVRPCWLRVERRFLGGPAARLVVELRFVPLEEGTRVTYEARIYPRNVLLRPIVALDAHTSTKATLGDALRRGVALLDGGPDRYDPAPPPLAPSVRSRLDAALAGVEPAPLRDALTAELLHAPLSRQARIQPRVLARLARVSDEVAVPALLRAVGDGLLALRFEAICPSCLGGAEVPHPMAGVVHCTSCNLPFDGSWPGSVHVVLRPSPWVRTVEVPPACLVSPGRTPHVVEMRTLPAGGEIVLETSLEAGLWRLVVGDGPHGATLDARPDGPTEARVTVDGLRVEPQVVSIGVGPMKIVVSSLSATSQQVRLERRFSLPLALTAARLLELPEASFAAPAVHRLDSEALRGALVAIQAARRGAAVDVADAEAAMRAADPIAVGKGDGFFLAAYGDPAVALRLAEGLAGDARWAVSLDCGRILGVRLPGSTAASRRTDREPALLAGGVVERLLQAVQEVSPGRIGFDRAALEDAAFAALLNREREAGRLDWDSRLKVRVHHLDVVASARAPRTDPVHNLSLDTLIGRGRFGRRHLAKLAGDAHQVVAEVVPGDKVARVAAAMGLRSGLDLPGLLPVSWRDGLLIDQPTAGMPLDRRLGAPLPTADVKQLGLRLLEILAAVHAAGRVWRDLRPGDVWCFDDGRCGLRGVGALCVAGVNEPLEDPSPFAAPEVVTLGSVDGRADLFACGAILLHAATGRPPGVRGPAPRGLAALTQAMAPHPAERFVSADEMIGVLRAG